MALGYDTYVYLFHSTINYMCMCTRSVQKALAYTERISGSQSDVQMLGLNRLLFKRLTTQHLPHHSAVPLSGHRGPPRRLPTACVFSAVCTFVVQMCLISRVHLLAVSLLPGNMSTIIVLTNHCGDYHGRSIDIYG